MKITAYLIVTLFVIHVAMAQDKLKEGDLLFQHLNCGPMCQAIEAVTEGVNGKDFAHCAMVINDNDTLKVIEAIGSGVQISSLAKFVKRSGDTLKLENITVARLKPEYSSLIPLAVSFARKQMGTPYDDVFLLNNNKFYCSELLYEAFKVANQNHDFFELYPMTFKDPATHNFFPAWVTYYKNLNQPIPEGKPGLNPGSVSRSPKLQILNVEKIP